MAGLRERKKLATRRALHQAGLRLFAERGFAGTTIDEIAEAADVSRATVFSYFPTKEDIVLGDAPQAVEALAAALGDRDPATSTLPAVRAWLRQLAGWIEPDLILQHRLAREVPSVGARRLQIHRAIEEVIADALERELGAHLPARLAAAALVSGLSIVEDTAVAQMQEHGRPLTDAEVDALLDDALAFAQAGVSALALPRAAEG